MTLFRRRPAIGLILFLAALPALGASGWTPLGPPGGNVYALVADPSTPGTLYAGMYASGVLKSTDGGRTWTATPSPLRGWSVHALAIDPSRPKTLYAGTWDQGVWKTTDGGATWKRVLYNEPKQSTILAIEIDPKNPQTVVAATDTGMGEGVYRSTDGGATWARSTQGLPEHFRLYAMAMAPGAPSTIYATPGEGVIKSTDGGRTWKEVGAGSAIAKKLVRSLAVDPSSPDVVFAGTLNSGAFKSTDGGTTWKAAARGMDDQHVYGLFIEPSRPDTVWAGISNGVLRTEDGGQRWAETTSGYGYMHFGPLLPDLDKAKAGGMYAGSSREGVVKSSDGGKTWKGPGTGFTAHDVTAVVTDPGSPSTIWVGTRANGIFRSTDSGATWQLLEEGLDDRGIIRLVIDPASHTLYAGTDNGIFKSVNGGDKWTHPKSSLKVMTLALDPGNPKVLYVRDRFGVYRSADAGETWAEVKGPFDVGSSLNGLFATTVVAGPPETAFVSFHRQMNKISDGKTVTLAGSGIPPTAKVQVLVADPAKNLYVGTETEGIYKSTDGGASWKESRAGIGDSNVQALLVDPASPSTLYAAVWTKGVFKSADAGKTWARVGGEPPHPDPVALAIDYSAPGRVLIGTGGGSVWRVDTTSAEPPKVSKPPAKSPPKRKK